MTVYTDNLYTAYRAVLHGSIDVVVQVTKEPVSKPCVGTLGPSS